jgi:hypothetical protein
LAVLFVLVLTVATGSAWLAGVPLQLPGVILLLPLVAVALSLAGRLQIARSEGTRAGLPLTSWGLGLSIVPALLFLTYSGVKDFAVGQEATAFTDDWFARLRQSDAEASNRFSAFWDSLPRDLRAEDLDLANPAVRRALTGDPQQVAAVEEAAARRYSFGDVGQKGPLPLYQEHPLVKFVRGLPEDAKIRPRGVRGWEYNAKARGYIVEQAYQITTLEGNFDAVVTIMGSQSRTGPDRDWQILLERTGLSDTPASLTPTGRLLGQLRYDSLGFARSWIQLLAEQNVREAYLRTLPADQRDRADQLLRAEPSLRAAALADLAGGCDPGTVLGSLPLLADEDLPGRLFLPHRDEFRTGRWLGRRPRAARPDIGAAAFDDARQWFRGSAGPFPQLAQPSNPLAFRWRLDGDQLIFEHSFTVQRMPEQRTANRPFPGYTCDGVMRVVTDDAALVNAVKSPGASPVPTLDPQRSFQRWRVAGMELRLAYPPGRGAGP